MKVRYTFEYEEIKDCSNCPIHGYDGTHLFCNLNGEMIRTNFINEQWWQEALAELMLKCTLGRWNNV